MGIETVLLDFLDGISPGEIALRYRSLTLEQVYATITYYLQQRPAVGAYLEAYKRESELAHERQAQRPGDVVKRLRALKQPAS